MASGSDLYASIRTRLAAAAPELTDVLLFGSHARGSQRPDSDVDLVLLLPDGADRTSTLLRARRALRHLGVGFDLLLLTSAEWAQIQQDPSWFAREIRRDARSLDAAA